MSAEAQNGIHDLGLKRQVDLPPVLLVDFSKLFIMNFGTNQRLVCVAENCGTFEMLSGLVSR